MVTFRFLDITAAGLRQKKRVVREDAMSIRIVFVMLVAAVSMAFGFMAANAQQPQRARSPRNRCVSMFSTAAKSLPPTPMPTA